MRKASTLASSSSTDSERFSIGRLGRPHGLDGFLGVYVDEDDLVSLQPGSTVFLEDHPHIVRAVRRVGRGSQVAFEGVDDLEAAEEIRGLEIEIAERRQLGDDEYWPHDLIGLAVFDQTGQQVGVVKEVVAGPGQDRLMVERDEARFFEIPLVRDLVPVVDPERGRIEIVSIPGLIEPSG